MPSLVGIVVIGLSAVFGIVSGILIMKRPALFWPLLIVAMVAGAGLMVQGYAIVDEYFAAVLLFGVFFAAAAGGVHIHTRPQDIWNFLHRLIFSLFIFYMMFESVRGTIALHDPRIVRWVILYAMLGILAFLLAHDVFPFPNSTAAIFLIIWSGVLYFLFYLADGLYAENVLGLTRWIPQGNEWSGTAYATLPFLLLVPAALSLFFRKNAGRSQWIVWPLIALALFVANYYSSRTSFILIFGFIAIAVTALPFRKIVLIALVLIGMMFALGLASDSDFYTLIIQSAELHANTDSGRLQHTQAAWMAIQQTPGTLLFGYGTHATNTVLGPYLQKIHYFNDNIIPANIYSTGLAAHLLETGLIGMLLYYANFFFVGRRILLMGNATARALWLFALGMLALWPIISDIRDVILAYLMMMPDGLLVRLAAEEHREGARGNAGGQNTFPAVS